MKKVYDIKIEDLENILVLLKSNAYSMEIYKDIYLLESYLKRLRNNFRSSEKYNLLDAITDDVAYYEFYKPFYPFVEKFAKSGLNVWELDTKEDYSTFFISDEKAMEEAKLFYKKQGTTLYSHFLDFDYEADEHLKFIKPTKETSGESLFLRSVGEGFIFAPNYSNITKFTILIHEIQHVLDFYVNPSFSECFVIRESTSMLMEFLAADYIAKKYNLVDENFKRQWYIHCLSKLQAHDLTYKTEILEIAAKNPELNESELLELLNEVGYDKSDVIYYFEQAITSDYSYQIAYLIAIELYYLYYKDKEYTLRIIDDLVKNGNHTNIFEILSKYNIVLNTNMVSHEEKILQKK